MILFREVGEFLFCRTVYDLLPEYGLAMKLLEKLGLIQSSLESFCGGRFFHLQYAS